MDNLHKYIKQISAVKSFNLASTNEASAQTIDIIVPVFNGFEALLLCIESLLAHTNYKHAIHFVNDASTDSRVAPYLDQLESSHQHISVTHRTHNVGYLNNVNPYLLAAKSDVLLLNSDTQVTAGWLQEMRSIASDPQVGAVCPLSNHATLLTLENFKPEHLEILRSFTSYWFPIPTAVGFCMLIKHAVLKELEGFDPYYDPGYGEECDYSMLIRQMDLQIACAPAAFVYHQGSASFQNQASELQHQHQKLLDLRWPSYSQEVQNFSQQNPVKLIALHNQAKLLNKPSILHVVHGIDSLGGVELFTQQLLSKFNDDFHHCLLIPKRLKKEVGNDNDDLPFTLFEFGEYKPDHVIFNLPADLNHKSQDSYFKQLIEHGQFELVHFHSLVGVGTAVWPLICHKLGIPYFFFLHDHSGLCQIFSLSTTVNNQEVYCGKKRMQQDSVQCLQCIQQKTKKTKITTESFLSAHHKIWQLNIKHAHRIYFPSDYLKEIYQQSYNEIETKSEVFPPSFITGTTAQVKPLDPNNVTIAFLGQFGVLKGAQLYIDLYHQMNTDSLTWQIIGGVDPKYHDQLKSTHIQRLGNYESNQLKDLLKGVDLVVFTAQIPETYGITLTEAWIHGIPVVAPQLGAYAYRLKDEVNGFLYEPNNLASLISAITKFITKQCSKDPIRSIQVVNENQRKLEGLAKQYRHHCLQHASQPTWLNTHSNNPSVLKQPKSSTYQTMQKWLDSPATLEAEADWQQAPNHLLICVLGEDPKLIQLTKNSIEAYLEQPTFVTNEYLKSNTPSTSVLMLEAGNQLNDNLGNWVTYFNTSNNALCLADFALVNHKQQIYAPQFSGRYSWTNFLASNQQVGCLLLNQKHWPQNQWIELLGSSHSLGQWVHTAQAEPELKIGYFPYFSYVMPDVLWVKQWKKQSNILPKPNSKKTHRTLILVESNLVGTAKDKLLKRYQTQTLVNDIHTSLKICNSKSKKSILKSLQNEVFTHRLLLCDNIYFNQNTSLEKMLHDFNSSTLDVASIPAARDRYNPYIVAKKLGSAPYFYGIGRIKDMRFCQQNTPIEYDLLDDDFVFFKESAWHPDALEIVTDSNYYKHYKLSLFLQNAGFTLGIIQAQSIFKQDLPSQDLNKPANDLTAQRNEVIQSQTHLIEHTTYSMAFSCRQNCDLDLEMAAFKTPKTLPRVVAYAQDDWASGFYRIKSPITALAAANQISAHSLSTHHNHIPTPYEISRLEADTLLLHGYYSDQQLAALHHWSKQLNIHTVISIDDLLTHIPNYNPFSSKTPKDINTRIRLACSLADTLVVSTEVLANHYSPFHQHIQVIPNRLSKHIWPPSSPTQNNSNKLRIGWAGAGQHQADLAWLEPIVQTTQHLYEWVFFGDCPPALDTKNIEYHEPVDLIKYPEYLKGLNLDLAVAPLVNNPFNQAKSALKLIEFGALGIPVIASDLVCYHNSPATLLENTEATWIETIADFNRDRAKLLQAGLTLQEWVKNNYYLEDHLCQWLDVLKI
ncbi:MAG: glycosyltransferase [Marinicella sp.]